MKIVKDYILSLLLTVQLVLSLLPNIFGTVTTYSPEQDGLCLNCAIVSDTHADSNLFRDRTDILRQAYAGIAESSEQINVLLNVGDITNSGSAMDYRTQKRLESAYIHADHTVACFGNHDSWNGSADPHYEKAKSLYLRYIAGKGIRSESVYYSTQIEGYTFICLGTESLDLHEAQPVYSETQLAWFDRALTEAEQTGKPIFVLSHLPLSGHNGITGSALPDRIDAILHAHAAYDKPIFFFSGHCHTFSPAIFEREGNLCYVNLPSLEYNDETEYACTDAGGLGLSMEVYGDRVLLKARNFIKDQWVEGYRFEVGF